MYVIKHVPEDFIVTEISAVKPNSSGKFLYFRLWKKGLGTLEALERLGHALRCKHLSCAGNKDKRAVTEQVCSVPTRFKEKLEKLSFPGMRIELLGYGDEPVHLGELEGNKFKIIIRDIDSLPEISPRFRNLFGEQRFSTENAEIGRLIVKRDFEKAALLIAKQHSETGRIKTHIDQRDWIGALRCLPRKLLILFVHAYQSLLWNRAALLSDADILPIVGFGSEIQDDTTKKILEDENLKPSDFVIRELPEVSAEGAERAVWAEAKDLKIGELEDDEFFSGKKKVVLEFVLPKGSYATEFIRQQFQESPI